jgi:hypothetical protein
MELSDRYILVTLAKWPVRARVRRLPQPNDGDARTAGRAGVLTGRQLGPISTSCYLTWNDSQSVVRSRSWPALPRPGQAQRSGARCQVDRTTPE